MPPAMTPEGQATEAERQRIAAQAAQAREAGVMVQSSGRTGSAVAGATADMAASASPAVEPAQTDRLALNPDSGPNNQQRKLDFVGRSAWGGIYNAHALQTRTSPHQVMAGSVIAASLLTGLNSDLPDWRRVRTRSLSSLPIDNSVCHAGKLPRQ